MAHPGGRPLLFKTPEELQEKIDAYFADCDPHPKKTVRYQFAQVEEDFTDKNGLPSTRVVDDKSIPPERIEEYGITEQKHYTITGLANFLNTSRATLINYEDKDEFFNTIKGAKDKVEEYWENLLIGSNATGIIFNLKNNYGWQDKTEQDLTTNGKDLPQPIIPINVHRDDSNTEG